MDNELLDGFYLRDIRIEPLTGTVRKPDGDAHLPSRSVEVLLCLAKNPRRLVSREELLARVWGDTGQSSEALNHAVGDIRQALGDRAGNPSYIQTVPRRGYRLLVVPRRTAVEPRRREVEVQAPPFWQALVRHGVVQALVAYLLLGWAVIQVADATFDNLGLPRWTVPFVTFVVVGGIPIVILLSWFLELAEGRIVSDTGAQGAGFLSGLERNYLAIVAAYAIAIMGAGLYQLSIGFNPSTVSTQSVTSAPESDVEELIPVQPNSLAVLRFENVDDSAESAVFASGLSEDILDRVARVPGLLVSSRGDAWSLPPNATSEQVRNRLRVAYYLEGSARVTGDSITVVAQFIDSKSGFHIISQPFKRPLSEFTELQQEISNLIVAQLRAALPSDIQQRAVFDSEGAPPNAYSAYRRGVDQLELPRSEDTLKLAVRHFREALTIDPTYAAAFAGLCRARLASYELSGDARFLDAAENACGSALETAPRLPSVHRATGKLYFETGRLEEAREAYESALELDRQDVRAMLGLAPVFRRMQLYDEAEALIKRATELQPGNWRTLSALGALRYELGHYSEAADAYAKVAYLTPGDFIALGNRGTAHMLAGEFEEAIDAFQQSLAIEEDPAMLMNIGIMYYYLGEFDRSISFHERSTEATPNSESAWVNLGDSLYFADRREEAAAAFERGAALARDRMLRDPTDPENLTILAWAETMTSNVDQGISLAERARELAPADPYSHYYVGLIAFRAENVEATRVALERAVDLGYSTALLAAEPYLKPLHATRWFSGLVANQGE